MQPEVLSVSPDATAAEALGLMDERDIRVLPVLDAKRKMSRAAFALQVEQISFSGGEPAD